MAEAALSLCANILAAIGIAIVLFYALIVVTIITCRIYVSVRNALRVQWARHLATGKADQSCDNAAKTHVLIDEDDELSEADTAIFRVPQNPGERFRRFDVAPRSKRAH